MTDPLLSVENLRTHIHSGDGIVRAVDGVDLTVKRGETVCLVGESGSGKSLTCDTIAGLVDPQADISGSVRFDGRDVLPLEERSRRSLRGDRIAYVFQNAQSALDPVYTIGEQLIESIEFNRDVAAADPRHVAIELLREVGLSRPEERLDQYPHELSDGMSQRVAIAIGLAGDPDLLIADEPTSALDLMVQARIIDVLADLKRRRELSMLLVTHDLRVAAAVADRIVVLYGGTPVERGPAATVLEHPAHPYTRELLRTFVGEFPKSSDATHIPDHGCRFHRECPLVEEQCRNGRPPFEVVDNNEDHTTACIYHETDRDPGAIAERIPVERIGEFEPDHMENRPTSGNEDRDWPGNDSNV